MAYQMGYRDSTKNHINICKSSPNKNDINVQSDTSVRLFQTSI